MENINNFRRPLSSKKNNDTILPNKRPLFQYLKKDQNYKLNYLRKTQTPVIETKNNSITNRQKSNNPKYKERLEKRHKEAQEKIRKIREEKNIKEMNNLYNKPKIDKNSKKIANTLHRYGYNQNKEELMIVKLKIRLNL